MKWADGVRVGPIEHLPSIPTHLDEADVAEYLQVLGHGRLSQAELIDDVTDRSFGSGEENEDVAPSRFGDGVEDVGSRGRTRHDPIIFRIRNMSSPQVGGHFGALWVVGDLDRRLRPAQGCAVVFLVARGAVGAGLDEQRDHPQVAIPGG